MATNEKQWGNLAKFIYDIAKLTFGGFIIGNIISKESIDWGIIALGLIITAIQVFTAFYLDGKGE